MASDTILLDAGLLIAALLEGDPRHIEALPIIEAARSGVLKCCTTTGILSEVYAALTWSGALPPHSPKDSAAAVASLVDPPSQLSVLNEGPQAVSRMLSLSVAHMLTARRVHDARHASVALSAGVSRVMTYDIHDWAVFQVDGIQIVGPPSVIPSHANT